MKHGFALRVSSLLIALLVVTLLLMAPHKASARGLDGPGPSPAPQPPAAESARSLADNPGPSPAPTPPTTATAKKLASGPGPSPAPSPSPAASNSNWTTYSGHGFSVNYPSAWLASPGAHQMIFGERNGQMSLFVEYYPNPYDPNDPNAYYSPYSTVQAKLKDLQGSLDNYQPLRLAPKSTVGGQIWYQGAVGGAIIGNDGNDGPPMTFWILSTNHPAATPSTVLFEAVCVTNDNYAKQAGSPSCSSLLGSFKFLS